MLSLPVGVVRPLAFKFFIFRAVALLASLGYSGHVLMYAPQDILACRLATTRTILNSNLL